MTDQQTLLPRFQRAIMVHDADYVIRDALEEMHREDYSQAVVQVEGRLRLLTHDGLGRLMVDAWNNDYVDLKHPGIGDALRYESLGTMVVMAGDRTVTEAREVFARLTTPPMDLFHNNLNSYAPDPGTDRGPMSSSYSLTGPMYAIVITNSGDDRGRPLGIVTPWDLGSP